MVIKTFNIFFASDEEWKEKVRKMTGHPDADDESSAKAFVRSVLPDHGHG